MSDEVTILRAPARFTLDELAERLRGPLEAAGAERAIVFGSWARGKADGFSDLDLVVVLQTDLPRVERGKLLAGVLDASPIPVDLLVYTPEEFERGMSKPSLESQYVRRRGVTFVPEHLRLKTACATRSNGEKLVQHGGGTHRLRAERSIQGQAPSQIR